MSNKSISISAGDLEAYNPFQNKRCVFSSSLKSNNILRKSEIGVIPLFIILYRVFLMMS